MTLGETAALYVERMGWSIIPVAKNKKAIVEWTPYQTRRPTQEEIKEWWIKYPNANIAAVTGAVSDLAVIDVDDMSEKANIDKLIPAGLQFPISRTPSGGLHYFFKCPDKLRNSVKKIAGSDVRAEKGYVLLPPSKGEHRDTGVLGDYSWAVKPSLIKRPTFPSPYLTLIQQVQVNNCISQVVGKMFQDGTRDEDLFHTANCLIKAGMLSTKVEQIVNILADYCQPKFSLAEAKQKVASAMQRAARKDHQWNTEIIGWLEQASGTFRIQDVYMDLGATTTSDKSSVRVVLGRMVKEGSVARNTGSTGSYRKVEEVCSVIDYESADEKPFPIRYPLGINKYFETYPKNIIVLAGEPDAGKTALMLNIADMNLNTGKPVMYFSSEMGKGELRRRLDYFDRPLDSWRKQGFIAKDRSSNFADVIEPDGINLIDYMEIHDEMWKIGGWIRQVYDKLHGGIAIIAIQRKKGNELGKGGLATLEKPRLYLNVGHGELTIVKCKNWAMSGVNPKDRITKFKLVNGCHFIQDEEGWIKGD